MLPNPYELTTETALAMQAAIENLYSVFSPYLSVPLDEGSPISVTEEMRKPLLDKPLRQLTRKDLDSFVFKLLTTWGGEDNMRRFLPRILELMAGNGFYDWMLTIEDFFGKFNRANWRGWSQTEQQAIESYCETLFRYILADAPLDSIGFSKVEVYLRGVSRIVDINVYLAIWEQTQTQTSTLQIAHLVAGNSKIHREQGNVWFVEWQKLALPELENWILRKATIQRIQSLHEELPENEHRFMLQTAIDALRWLMFNYDDWYKDK
jgi:hypothetical protein